MLPFHYHAPETMSDAVALLASAPQETKILAGGTDLLVLMRRGRLRPTHVVDVKKIAELNEIAFDPGKGLRFGAAVSCAVLCENPSLRLNYPGLLDAFSLIGGVATQGRATIGGNVGNAAPSADSIPPLIVHGAECHVAGPAGRRAIPIDRFCRGPGLHALEPGEVLASFHVPAPRAGSCGAYLRFTPRGEMDIAVAGVAVWLRLDGRVVAEARVALTSVAPIPLPVPEAADALVGEETGPGLLARAGEVAAAAAQPISDHRGSADQRRQLIRVLTVRALEQAIARIRTGSRP